MSPSQQYPFACNTSRRWTAMDFFAPLQKKVPARSAPRSAGRAWFLLHLSLLHFNFVSCSSFSRHLQASCRRCCTHGVMQELHSITQHFTNLQPSWSCRSALAESGKHGRHLYGTKTYQKNRHMSAGLQHRHVCNMYILYIDAKVRLYYLIFTFKFIS